MKKAILILSMLAVALAACVRKESLPSLPEPGSLTIKPAYDREVRTVVMDDRTTCYVVTGGGNEAISCVRK